MKKCLLACFLVINSLLAACIGPPPLPQADFEASITSGPAPLTVIFSNKSRNADEFQWDFGDGDTATSGAIEESVVHEYTKVGIHEVTLTALQIGELSETSTMTLTITVKPAALDTVTLPPLLEIAAGATEQLAVVAADRYGNNVSEIDLMWSVTDEAVGSVTETGLLTAGKSTGSFHNAVEVGIVQGEVARTAVASVAITPGPLTQVVLAPDKIDLGMEMTQQFVAAGADQYGNRISGLDFTWSLQTGAGAIDADGLFTAGNTPGTYTDAVKVETTWGGIIRSDVADVAVEPDRIAFISDQNDEQLDIYVVDADGDNMERLTATPGTEFRCSWSPDGRRIVYDFLTSTGGIMAMNDDGSWKTRFIENEGNVVYVYPAWSPDGGKIAFIKATQIEESWEYTDIFVMKVDGSNVTQFTDTAGGAEWTPDWSPDGSKIVYDYTPQGRTGDIYTINANGSYRENLTSHSASEVAPAWSPDGSQIAFISNRDGGYHIYTMDTNGDNVRQLTFGMGINDLNPGWSPDGARIVFQSDRGMGGGWNIYVMNADGSNVTRLTDIFSNGGPPVWAPRKTGITVGEASIIIPETVARKTMTAQEVTARVSQSVVRIETDLVAGSGFIVDAAGLILTNNHVISGAEEITVYLKDGTAYAGTVEAVDMVRDLALVSVNASELFPLELGDLSEVGLAQQVIVLGYPLGGENITVTSGLVSAIEFDSGRNITWVQTDSAINPGNSGGPLLDLQGQAIGVVSAKMVGWGIEGVGFAISANTVKTYLPRLQAGETIVNGE